MKKIKFTIMILAVLSSVAGAYATRPKHVSPDEFFWNGLNFEPTNGIYGGGFYCAVNSGSNCTYIQDVNNNYVMYRLGVYTIIPGHGAKNSTKKAK